MIFMRPPQHGQETQPNYIRSVKNLAMFLGRSPDTASNVCFGAGSRRRSAPQVSDLIDSAGVTLRRLFTRERLLGRFSHMLFTTCRVITSFAFIAIPHHPTIAFSISSIGILT